MGLRASGPAGHHGWGGRWRRCGRRPGFRGGPPYLARGAGPVSGGGEELRKFAQIPNPQLPHCRLHPGDRSCRSWEEARKGVAVLHREARRIARDVAEIPEATAGCAAILHEFCDGSVGYFALEAPPGQEAGEGTGRALEEGGSAGQESSGCRRRRELRKTTCRGYSMNEELPCPGGPGVQPPGAPGPEPDGPGPHGGDSHHPGDGTERLGDQVHRPRGGRTAGAGTGDAWRRRDDQGRPDGIRERPEFSRNTWVTLECKSMSPEKVEEVRRDGSTKVYPGTWRRSVCTGEPSVR